MKKIGTKGIILGSAAILALIPRKIHTEHRVDDGGKRKLSRLTLNSTLFGVDIGNAGDGKKSVSVSILPDSDTIGRKLEELSGKIKELRSGYSEKKKEKQLRPLYKRALELVSKKSTVDVPYLCRKLGVGQSCSEAFLEIMEEMNIVAPADEGKYRVIMPKKGIDMLISQS